MTDYDSLIRRYEPVLGFGKDGQRQPECFFPMAVDDYVAHCSLWHEGREVLPPGQVALQTLAGLGADSEHYYLSYATREVVALIAEQVRAATMDRDITLSRLAALEDQVALSLRATPREAEGLLEEGLTALPAPVGDAERPWAAALEGLPSAPGEAVGEGEERLNTIYGEPGGPEAEPDSLSGFVAPLQEEAEESVDLVLMPRQAGEPDDQGALDRDVDVAAAFDMGDAVHDVLSRATQLGQQILDRAKENYYGGATHGSPPLPPAYYYHVAPDHKGYTVLQYWFFYAYNDWGTAHGGLNDHEGDWEGVMVFLRDENTPEYVAYSRHVRVPPVPLPPWVLGPDTSRWDDACVIKLYGCHPVVRVGCGSHASYIEAKTHVLGLRGVLSAKDYAVDDQIRVGPGQLIRWERRIDLAHEDWSGFGGHWGVLKRGLRGLGTASPQGPRSKARWNRPVRWAWIPAR